MEIPSHSTGSGFSRRFWQYEENPLHRENLTFATPSKKHSCTGVTAQWRRLAKHAIPGRGFPSLNPLELAFGLAAGGKTALVKTRWRRTKVRAREGGEKARQTRVERGTVRELLKVLRRPGRARRSDAPPDEE